MVRSPQFSFVQFYESPPDTCIALPVASLSDLAFFVFVDSGFKLRLRFDFPKISLVAPKRFAGRRLCIDCARLFMTGGFPNLSDFLNCGECFRITLVDSDGREWHSGNFQYVCNTVYTSVVEYSLHGAGFGFGWDCLPCKNRVRLPLYLTEPQFPQEQEIYALKSGYRRLLASSVDKTFLLKTDYLPEDLHGKLVIALSHNDIRIDGLSLSKSEAYQIDWSNSETIQGVKFAVASARMIENVTYRNDGCEICSDMEDCNFDWLSDGAVCQMVNEAETCEFKWLEHGSVCQLTEDDKYETLEFTQYFCLAGSSAIVPTNQTSGQFVCAVTGPDGKMYFGTAYNRDLRGVYRLDDDGQVRPTNVCSTGDYFMCAALFEGKLYFGSSSGVWLLDNNTGDINQISSEGCFYCCAPVRGDGVYFGGSGRIYKVDSGGVVAPVTTYTRLLYCAAFDANGRLFFAGASGIDYLDANGQFASVNTDGNFACAAVGQDKQLYFGAAVGTGFYGAYRYNPDANTVTMVDGTDGQQFGVMQLDILRKRLLMGSSLNSGVGGIWGLSDDGTATKLTPMQSSHGGRFFCAGIAQDGLQYFAGDGSNGMVSFAFTGNDSTFAANMQGRGFKAAAFSAQTKSLYFAGDGIYRLKINPIGKAVPTFAVLKKYRSGELIDTEHITLVYNSGMPNLYVDESSALRYIDAAIAPHITDKTQIINPDGKIIDSADCSTT